MNINKIKNEIVCIIKADSMIANYPEIKARNNRVNLWELNIKEHFKSDKFGNYNLGDCLARVVVEFMLSRNGLSLESPIEGRKHLNSIGSNILYSYQDATIWGSGIERVYPCYRDFFHTRMLRKLDVRALRGPLTKKYLEKLGHKCPDIFGDPAILMPYIYMPKRDELNIREYCIIPQYISENKIREFYHDDVIVSMKTDDYKYVIDSIVKSKMVISSSLHGIILAESYGIPAVFYRGLDKAVDFKYRDYFESTGRYDVPVASSIEEAMDMNTLPLPDLSSLQKGLIESFPYDLWEANLK